MLPRMLGMGDLDTRALRAARQMDAGGTSMRLAVHCASKWGGPRATARRPTPSAPRPAPVAVKRSIDAAHAAGASRLPPGYVPRSATDLGMVLAGHPALTSCANALQADAGASSSWGTTDSLQLVVQVRRRRRCRGGRVWGVLLVMY